MNFVVSIIALIGLLCCVSVAEGYNYTSIGCFVDRKRPARAIASLEGTSELLDGRFHRRQNATAKCAELAYSLNFTIFAVARGGECLGDGQSNDTMNMYGPSDNCQPDGEGGRRPAAMEVYEITEDICQELEVDCYGDCCETWGSETEMRCMGYYDWNTHCQLGADYCMPFEMNNTRYAKSLGAPEVCPMYCSYQCDYTTEISCWSNWDGCGYSYCNYIGNNNFTGQGAAMRASSGNGTDGCYPTCPTICSQYDLVCSSGTDENGCSYGDYCTPRATDKWDGSGECPGVCYTPCNYNAGEVYCPIESQDGCYAGNYCEMPDADGNACQGTAMRFDPEDELMLRSGSPDSVAAFYKKLTDMARK